MGIASYIINKVLPVQITKIQRTLAFSTTPPLGANAVYTSPTIDAISYKLTQYRAVSDVGGIVVVQNSDDGITWDAVNTSTVTANTANVTNVNCYLKYVRMVYTNGAAAQTSFRLSAYLSPL